ncbi:hypothetical protein SARC_13101, partial [Sphaeroforma arctica JP610]
QHTPLWAIRSALVEYHSALAQLVGREGRGIATIMDMVALTRLDCTTGSSALIKQVYLQNFKPYTVCGVTQVGSGGRSRETGSLGHLD